jgi:hypothetical protein
MAENHRLTNDVWSDTSVLIVMHVAPAYADSVKGNPHIVRPKRFINGKIAKREFMLLFEDECFHCWSRFRWLNKSASLAKNRGTIKSLLYLSS